MMNHQIEEAIGSLPDPRHPGYYFLGGQMLTLGRKSFVVETGCRVYPDRIYRTEMFHNLSKLTQGSVISVDLDGRSVTHARSRMKRGAVAQQDPILYLSSAAVVVATDLLFLGTHRDTAHEAELQHAGELAACYHRLKPGCLIAVDGECDVLRNFFRKAGVEPMITGEITAWRKP